jgi:hypothetical protein
MLESRLRFDLGERSAIGYAARILLGAVWRKYNQFRPPPRTGFDPPYIDLLRRLPVPSRAAGLQALCCLTAAIEEEQQCEGKVA